jgi:hypothetical protein
VGTCAGVWRRQCVARNGGLLQGLDRGTGANRGGGIARGAGSYSLLSRVGVGPTDGFGNGAKPGGGIARGAGSYGVVSRVRGHLGRVPGVSQDSSCLGVRR